MQMDSELRDRYLRTWGLLGDEVLQTFDAYRVDTPQQEKVKSACAAWRPKAERNWVALFGKCGCGKDHLASAMLLAHADGMRACYADSAAGVLALFRQRAYQDDGEMEALRWFVRLDALVLRDVGVKTATAAEFGTIVEILDRRYRAGRAVIITSNMTPSEFRAAFSDRVADRLWHRGIIMDGKPYLVCDWDSWRVKSATCNNVGSTA